LRKTQQDSHFAFVYAIVAPDVQRVKIGMSESIRKRIADLRGHGPAALYLHAFVKMPTYKLARMAEKRLHKELKSRCTHGEWFIFDSFVERRLSYFVGAEQELAYEEEISEDERRLINYCLYMR
jgi:hypothetical protein